jgi:hypothetical protein
MIPAAWAQTKPQEDGGLRARAFFASRLRLLTENAEVTPDTSLALTGRPAVDAFFQQGTAGKFRVFMDRRTGAVTSMMGAMPLIPGNGQGNAVSLGDVSRRLGRRVAGIDASVVADLVRNHVVSQSAVLGIDPSQLGAATAERVDTELWQVSIPQVYRGIPVRYGRVLATVSHGNIVLMGAENFASVRGLDVDPRLSAAEAEAVGFAYADGRFVDDLIVQDPTLEIVPVDAGDGTELYLGETGRGYSHELVWTFAFQRESEGDAAWKAQVNAHTGTLLAFEDSNLYVDRTIKGGIYPSTSTGICPDNARCGTMQLDSPMPFANTGFASPNNFTDSGGVYNYTSGTATTTLNGRYIRVLDSCGSISNSSSTGDINLGGSNNQHDCTTGGGSAGNTPASRSAFYELNGIHAQARGWLPNNSWLNAQLTANVNLNNTCNAFWNGSSVNFYRSGGGCRNTGEIAGVFDHEWGHGMDDNDAAGSLSNSSEAYADIAAIYRLQTSCVGYGFFQTVDDGCGQTADGTGFNVNEAQTGAAYCATDCSGVRDSDYAKHSPATPATPLGFVCGQCNTGSGPCGRQVHCAAAPVRQAAWDLVARDLAGSPFNLDSQTAFMIGNRLFYLGSGNVGAWHSCTCGGSANGCGSSNGYMQWLAADDDNGNLNDGTPHMQAIFNAFNRHGIACSTPTVQNSGCSGGPTTAPTLTATPGDSSVSLSWNSVSGASRYWVFRSEGFAGCNFGKTRIADITGTSFVDSSVANGRAYSYNVVAVGSSSSCFSRMSTCQTVTPNVGTTPDFSIACSPSSLSIAQGASGTSTCTVTSTGGFSSAVSLSCSGQPAGVSCSYSPSSVTPPANGSVNSTLTVSVASSTATGSSTFQAQGTSGATTRSANINLTVTGTGGGDVFFDDFETDLGWSRTGTTNTATTGLWERGDPQQTASGSSVMQLGTTPSGTFALVTGATAGASVGANDVDGGTTSIQSAPITLPSSGTLTLSFSFYMAHLNNSSSADFFRVSIVGSSGTTQVFQEVGAANTDVASYATQSVNISSFAGQSIRILIQAADASTGSLVEAAVDNVRITQQ